MFPVVAHSVCNTKEKWTITWRHDDGRAASDDGEVEKAIDEGAHTKYCRVFYVLYVYVLLGCAVILCEWVPSHNPSTQSLSLYGPLSLSLSLVAFCISLASFALFCMGRDCWTLSRLLRTPMPCTTFWTRRFTVFFSSFPRIFVNTMILVLFLPFFLHFLGCCHFASRAYMTKKKTKNKKKRNVRSICVYCLGHISHCMRNALYYTFTFPPARDHLQ